MLNESHPDKLVYYRVTHVEYEGNIYEIFPIGNKAGSFLVIPEDGGVSETLTQDQLDERGFMPIEIEKQVKMDSETSFPKDLVDQLEQMRYSTQGILDWQEEEFPRNK